MNRLFEQNKSVMLPLLDSIFYFRTQNYYIAYERSNMALRGVEQMVQLLVEEQRANEAQEFLPVLTQAMEAMEAQDATRLADIFEEGIYPFLCQLQADLFQNEEDVIADYWGSNRRVLREKFPGLYRQLLSVRENISDDYQLSFARTGEPVLQVSMEKETVCLNSAVDPWREALTYAESEVSQDYAEYLMIGFGMGYHVQAMLRHPLCQKLVVLESDLNQLAIAMAYRNYAGFMKNRDITIVYCQKPEEYLGWMKKCGSQMKCCMWQPSVRTIRDRNLKEALENYWVENLSIRNMGRMLESNFASNQQKKDEEISVLQDKFKGKTMILAAAGPSLDNDIDKLKNRDITQTVLVCVGKVARKLIQAGVTPDYIVMIDAKPATKRWIEGIEECGVPLLYLGTVASAVVNGYQSKRYIAFQKDFPPAEEYAREQGYPLYETGGSVATFALDIGIRLGCKKIVCVGLDLGYPTGKTHTSGVGGNVADTSSLRQVEGVGGTTVKTNKTMDIYRRWIERRIEGETGIEFVNASAGARIHGMKEMPLSGN